MCVLYINISTNSERARESKKKNVKISAANVKGITESE